MIKSLLLKNIVYILLCSTLFLLAVTPFVEQTAFHMLQPLLAEYTTLSVNKAATRMSNFLALSNTALRVRIRTSDFQDALFRYIHFDSSEKEFQNDIQAALKPLETSFSMDENHDFSSVSYPAFYIEEKGLFCGSSIQYAAETFVQENWFQNYQQKHSSDSSYFIFSPSKSNADSERYFCFVSSRTTSDSSQTKYYSILFTKFSDIEKLWENLLHLGIEDYAFLGIDREILYQNLSDSVLDFDYVRESMLSDNQHLVISSRDTVKNGVMYSVLVSYKQEGLRFLVFVDNHVFNRLFRNYNMLLRIIILALAAVFILLFIILLKQIFKRLWRLSEKMVVVQQGNYQVVLEDDREDEISQLTHSFNVMTEQIRKNIEQIRTQEEQAKLLQYNLMVSAINPHFIYNTLNTSTHLAEFGRISEVVEVNDALINFLRDNLKLKSSQFYDRLENELDVLRQYIIIQNYLCDNTITLQNHVSEKDLALSIPKFLLQPLVENAILHGIVMNIDEMGNSIPGIIDITVTHSKENGRIQISVKDNGIGMSQETIQQYFSNQAIAELSEKKQHEHIGIAIVYNRLAFLYGQDYRFSVDSTPGMGTEIHIEFPLKK